MAGAKRDWWSLTKPDYLTYVSDTNQKQEDRQTAIGNDYVDVVTAITTADVAYLTSAANAGEAQAISAASVRESYAQAMANARGDYLTATDQSTAADDYRSAVTTAWGERRTGLANASKTYSDAVNGTTGARVTWQSAYDAAIKDFTDDQSNERADLQIDLATLDAAYATLESQSYATALSNLATTSPSPWATQAASEAQAMADRVADIATEAVAWCTAAANATRQEQIDAATAQEALSTAESAAAATWADSTSTARTAQATAEADAEEDQAAGGASTIPLPRSSLTDSYCMGVGTMMRMAERATLRRAPQPPPVPPRDVADEIMTNYFDDFRDRLDEAKARKAGGEVVIMLINPKDRHCFVWLVARGLVWDMWAMICNGIRVAHREARVELTNVANDPDVPAIGHAAANTGYYMTYVSEGWSHGAMRYSQIFGMGAVVAPAARLPGAQKVIDLATPAVPYVIGTGTGIHGVNIAARLGSEEGRATLSTGEFVDLGLGVWATRATWQWANSPEQVLARMARGTGNLQCYQYRDGASAALGRLGHQHVRVRVYTGCTHRDVDGTAEAFIAGRLREKLIVTPQHCSIYSRKMAQIPGHNGIVALDGEHVAIMIRNRMVYDNNGPVTTARLGAWFDDLYVKAGTLYIEIY